MPKDIIVTNSFLEADKALRDARAARFAANETVPPVERRLRIAWPGGRLTTNKQDAVRAFIERKRREGGLSKGQEVAIRASLLVRGASAAVVQPTVAASYMVNSPSIELATIGAPDVNKLPLAQRSHSPSNKLRHEKKNRRSAHSRVTYVLRTLVARRNHRKTSALYAFFGRRFRVKLAS